jgi:hypothetical protein
VGFVLLDAPILHNKDRAALRARDMQGVTIVPKTGDINKQFGVYSNVCCGYEIIIREGASFPNCPNHRTHQTTWNFLETEKIQPIIIRKQSQSNPAA